MLDLELDLEADLGIDTVKQAETFAAVREAYDIPREDSLELREFPTLGHVVQFVRDRRPDLVPAPAPGTVPAPASAPVPASAPAPAPASEDSITQKVLEVVASVTGYPPEMLELDLDLEADLGIDTVKQAETFAAVREAYGIPRDDKLELRNFPTLHHVIAWVKESMPEAAPSAAAQAEAADASPAAVAAHEPAEGLRRVPIAVLRPPLSACKPTGAELVEGITRRRDGRSGTGRKGAGQAVEEARRRRAHRRRHALCGRAQSEARRLDEGRSDPRRLLACWARPRRPNRRSLAGRLDHRGSKARQAFVHDDAHALRADLGTGHVPDVGDAPWRKARLRRDWRRGATRRRRWRLNQDLQTRETRSDGQGRRLRGKSEGKHRRRTTHRRDLVGPRGMRAWLRRRRTLGDHGIFRSGADLAPVRTRARTASLRSPALPGRSCLRSSRTWPRRRLEPSICSTSRPSRMPTTPTFNASQATAMAFSVSSSSG